MKKTGIYGVSAIMILGVVSQVIERTIDKPAVQNFVEEHFVESDDDEQNFNFRDEVDETIWQKIGF